MQNALLLDLCARNGAAVSQKHTEDVGVPAGLQLLGCAKHHSPGQRSPTVIVGCARVRAASEQDAYLIEERELI